MLRTFEKIRAIDTDNNRHAVATTIINDVFKCYGLSMENNRVLYTWFFNHLFNQPLEVLIEEEHTLFVKTLANKCMHDIIASVDEEINEDNYKPILISFGEIGQFVCAAIVDCKLNCIMGQFIDESNSTAYDSKELVIDDTQYTYAHGYKKEYNIVFSILHHPAYTIEELKRRIRNRLSYRWHDCEIIGVDCHPYSGHFLGYATIKTLLDCEEVEKYLNHRFGATSGKPWYRCEVVSIDEV